MKPLLAEIITIGDELLIGQITNTNSSWIAKELNLIGISINRMVSVGDNIQEIISCFKESSSRADVILITGGLGPTSDDITKPAICQYFNTKLIFNQDVFNNVDSFISKRGGSMNELNKSQAMVPESAKIINNPIGTAPGLWFDIENKIYISMPGVPFEMYEMMNNLVIPALQKRYELPFIYHKSILTAGVPESKLAIEIASWENQLPEQIKLAYLPSSGMVKLRLSGSGNESIVESIDKEIVKLNKIIGNTIVGYDNDSLENIIGKILLSQNKTLSVFESCTGGYISKLITSVSGCSAYYKGGIVAYSNQIKEQLLHVSSETLMEFGAVSSQVVETMATNGLKIMDTDYSIAISGIAGPTGGSIEKPVGCVWIAVASKYKVHSQMFNFGDNRERNIIRSSNTAINLLRLHILENKL